MEGSVKERLTGALIVVAALVIILSEMFSGPEAPSPGAAAVSLPADAGPPVRTYSMTLDDSGQPGAVSAAVVDTPAVEPAASRPTPAATVAADHVAEPAPAAATKTTLASESASSSAGGNWWVRIGIFASRENAERLTKKLRADGFNVDMDKYPNGGKDMFRVRAGPARDRAEALALQARLAASGNNSLLLPP
ncbi:MAG: SPOR domain-containing protein [Pseudomonadota bacterium]